MACGDERQRLFGPQWPGPNPLGCCRRADLLLGPDVGGRGAVRPGRPHTVGRPCYSVSWASPMTDDHLVGRAG